MAIDNVTSTLPDQEYIAALEKKIRQLESTLNKVVENQSASNRGR